MVWRYQPVFVEADGHAAYGVCEVYFSAKGELENWTDLVEPAADSPEEFRNVLTMMLLDSLKWKPVAWADLATGYKFERLPPSEEAERLSATLKANGVPASA